MAVEQLLVKLRVVVFSDRIGPCVSREHFCLVFLQRPVKFLAHNTCAMNICWMNTWKNWGNNNLTAEWGKWWSGKELWATRSSPCMWLTWGSPWTGGFSDSTPTNPDSRAAARTPHVECALQVMRCRCLRTVLENWSWEVMSCMETQPKIITSASVKWCEHGDQVQLAALETGSKP